MEKEEVHQRKTSGSSQLINVISSDGLTSFLELADYRCIYCALTMCKDVLVPSQRLKRKNILRAHPSEGNSCCFNRKKESSKRKAHRNQKLALIMI